MTILGNPLRPQRISSTRSSLVGTMAGVVVPHVCWREVVLPPAPHTNRMLLPVTHSHCSDNVYMYVTGFVAIALQPVESTCCSEGMM